MWEHVKTIAVDIVRPNLKQIVGTSPPLLHPPFPTMTLHPLLTSLFFHRLSDKSKNISVALVNLFQYTISVFIASLILALTSKKSQKDQSVFTTIFKQLTPGDILVGLFQFGSMNASTFALKYVTYPFVVLAKSAKVIPIILMGALRGVYNPTKK